MDIKFIYLDVGEVLVKGATSKEIAEKFLGINHEEFKKVYNKFYDLAYKAKISPREILEIYEKSFPNMKKINKDKFWEEWVASLSPMGEMHQLVYDLSKKYPLGILTNSYEGLFDLIEKNGKIPRINYKSIIESATVKLAKPEKEIFQLAEKMCGFKAGNIFFIDNRKANVEAAIENEWNGFLFDENNPKESVEKLRELLL